MGRAWVWVSGVMEISCAVDSRQYSSARAMIICGTGTWGTVLLWCYSAAIEPSRAIIIRLMIDEGRSVPEGESRRTKIAPLGQTALAPEAHLLAQSGYFRSASFSRSDSRF
jgi:hypothetical protein